MDWNFQHKITIDRDEKIVYVKIFGVWRGDIAKGFKEDFQEKITPMIEEPWAKLTDLQKWKMSTPEVVNILGAHMKWCSENNMQWQVFLINDPVRYGQLQKMMDKGRVRKKTAIFRNMFEAVNFLKEKGYQVTSTYMD